MAHPFGLSTGRNENSLVDDCFAFLISSLNPNIYLWVFIIQFIIQLIINRSFLIQTNQETARQHMQWTKTVEVTHLPMGTSSQKAKLIALIRELQIAKSQQDNIYTDSKYAFIIAHTHSVLWKERGFLTTKSTPIIDRLLIVKLLEASSSVQK